MSFVNKVMLITGAGSGIGAGAALHFSKLGAIVSLVDRNANNLRTVAQQIRSSNCPRPLEIIADVTQDTERIIDETVTKCGQLNVLVNSAGIVDFSNDLLGTLETYDRIMAVNVRSLYALSKLAIPHLAKTHGNIVNVSSVNGMRVLPNGTIYSMAKAAVNHFTRCAAVELGPLGIRVNAINPGAVDTPILESAGIVGDERVKYFEEVERVYPLGRAGRVSDTSTAIEFLADDAKASFITGHLLLLDGGKHLVR